MTPNKEEIKKQYIIDQLTWDDSVNANEVFVTVIDRSVKLSGKVPNYASKMAAERDAYLVAGVNMVDNYIEVEFPPGTTLPVDSEIENNVENLLKWNGSIDTTKIKVKVDEGEVTLSGTAKTYWEKYLAEDFTLNVHGVVDVTNRIMVEPVKNIVDIDIENDIISTFKRTPMLDEDKTEVNVNNGVVILKGIMPNYHVKNQALTSAMYTSGVKDVIDKIKIG
jgi:osmotically-inducible protein OsmY